MRCGLYGKQKTQLQVSVVSHVATEETVIYHGALTSLEDESESISSGKTKAKLVRTIIIIINF